MFPKRLRARLLAVAGLLTCAPAAIAVDGTPPPVAVPYTYAPAFAPVVAGCPDGCGVVVGPCVGGCTGLGAAGTGIGLFAPNRRNWRGIDGQNRPGCAVNSYPLSDWAYIRRFCGPTIIPGTCYGHFQTKWRKWEDHCPQQGGVGCETAAPLYSAPPAYSPPVVSQPQSMPLPVPMPVPMPEQPTSPPTGDTSLLLTPVPDLPEIPRPLPLR